MAQPDFTGYNAAVAGDLVTADDFHRNHPPAYYNTIAATAWAAANRTAASGSSVTIGAGAKTFVLDRFAGWPAGTPVYITETGDPIGNVITGHLTLPQDPDTNEIDVLVETFRGSGTFASWAVSALFSVAVVVSPPVAIADGGTGAVDEDGVRLAFELIRQVKVEAALFVEPGGPPIATFLVRKPASGANWTGHDNEWAKWNGASWSFEAPANGDMSLETGGFAGRLWIYSGALDEWIQVGHRNTVARLDPLDIGAGYALVVGDFTEAFGAPTGGQSPFLFVTVTNAAAGDQFLSLPDPLSFAPSSQPGDQITVMNRSGLQIRINVTGGSLIDGAADVAMPDGSSAAFFRRLSEWTQLW